MPTFEHDGIQFHYEDNGAGLPFVFQHGLGSDRSHPAGVFKGRPGIRLVTLENRGHGLSWPIGESSRYSFNDFADDVLALMAHLESGPFVAGGISMGAGIALNLAIRHPDRVKGLVLIRPAWLEKPYPDNLKSFAVLARHLRQWGAAEGLEQFRQSRDYSAMQQENPQAVMMLEEAFRQPGVAERAIRYEKMPADVPNRDTKDWEQITVPTLVIGCQNDTVHPFAMAQTLAEAIPGAVLVEVTAKTVDPERYVGEVQAALQDFLDNNFLAREPL